MKEMLEIWDCHVHAFGRDGIGDYPNVSKTSKFISMVDNPLKYKGEKLESYFDEYFKGNGKHVLPGYVLCVGRDADETEVIYKKWHDNIAGFGEIIAHKHYVDSDKKKHTITDITILNRVAGYSLPVFVHWDLDGEDDQSFENVLKEFPKTKFVLCHCGINELDDPYKAFLKAVKLQTKNPNLWLDISWKALDFICADMNRLPVIENLDHTLVGTDFNNSMKKFDINFTDIYNKFRKIVDKVNLPVAVKTLFTKI